MEHFELTYQGKSYKIDLQDDGTYEVSSKQTVVYSLIKTAKGEWQVKNNAPFPGGLLFIINDLIAGKYT